MSTAIDSLNKLFERALKTNNPHELKEACVMTREFFSNVHGRKALKNTANMSRIRQELNAILQMLLLSTNSHGIDKDVRIRAQTLIETIEQNKR